MEKIDQTISNHPLVILFVFLLATVGVGYLMRDDWRYKVGQWIRKILNHNKVT